MKESRGQGLCINLERLTQLGYAATHEVQGLAADGRRELVGQTVESLLSHSLSAGNIHAGNTALRCFLNDA